MCEEVNDPVLGQLQYEFGKLNFAIAQERQDPTVSGADLMKKAITRLDDQFARLETLVGREGRERQEQRSEEYALRSLANWVFDLALDLFWLIDDLVVHL
jgi:hypothetical protein